MNKEQKFAKESAEKIFNELLESDGFHTDNKLLASFIEETMAIKTHADKIKAEIRNHIFEDLNEFPEAFFYDANDKLIYDSDMRDNYEGVALGYILHIFESNQTKTLYICTHCNSDNVQVQVWVLPNNNHEYVDLVNDGDAPAWCDDCHMSAIVEIRELRVDAKVIGFQVVGEDGTEQEGENHPDMDEGYHVYSLEQARKMLRRTNPTGEQWQLLTIWEGDIDNPMKRFKGDPRN